VFIATDIRSGIDYRFRSLNALARRLGGNSYQVEHATAFNPPTRRVMILKRAPRSAGDHAFHVIATVSVPSEAVSE
jgi:hypothetical protein